MLVWALRVPHCGTSCSFELWPKRKRSGRCRLVEVAAKRQQQQEQAAAARARSSKTKTAEEAVAAMAKRMKRSVKVNATHAPGTVWANETASIGSRKKKKGAPLPFTNNYNTMAVAKKKRCTPNIHEQL